MRRDNVTKIFVGIADHGGIYDRLKTMTQIDVDEVLDHPDNGSE